MFIILTQDNYDTTMKEMMVMVNPWTACLFYVFGMIIGIYVALNLFLAILLSNLDQLKDLDYGFNITGGLTDGLRKMRTLGLSIRNLGASVRAAISRVRTKGRKGRIGFRVRSGPPYPGCAGEGGGREG